MDPPEPLDHGIPRKPQAPRPPLCFSKEGRRGSEEAVPGPSVFPSGDPGVSGRVPFPFPS